MVITHGGLFLNLLSWVEEKKTNLEGERHCFARGRIERDRHRTIVLRQKEKKKRKQERIRHTPTMEDGDTNAELQTAQGCMLIYVENEGEETMGGEGRQMIREEEEIKT